MLKCCYSPALFVPTLLGGGLNSLLQIYAYPLGVVAVRGYIFLSRSNIGLCPPGVTVITSRAPPRDAGLVVR